jgi:hypothetical protein
MDQSPRTGPQAASAPDDGMETREVVADLEDKVVDLDRLKAEDDRLEETTPDGVESVPGTPEPPD